MRAVRTCIGSVPLSAPAPGLSRPPQWFTGVPAVGGSIQLEHFGILGENACSIRCAFASVGTLFAMLHRGGAGLARLFTDTGCVPLLSQVIESRRQFDRLIQGYYELQAVSYVVSADLLLQLFRDYGFAQAEVIVGENLSGTSLIEQYRDSLKHRPRHVTRDLAELVAAGKLRVLVPRRCLHSKLYILRGPAGYRVIQGSANLTETARQASNQVNYVWYADVSDDDPWLRQVLRDYEAQRTDCQLFMGDLADLIRHRNDQDT